jgi:hypothetical protein
MENSPWKKQGKNIEQFSQKARSVDGRILSFLRSRRRTKIYVE